MATKKRRISDLRGTGLTHFGFVPAGTSGSPISGSYKKGDVYADADAVFWRCIISGTPGTWVEIAITSNTGTILGSNGSSLNRATISEEVTLAAAVFTDSTADLLPANSLIYGVVVRVTQAIVGPTSMKVGVSGDITKFVLSLATALGSTGNSFKETPPLYPFMNVTAGKVRLTRVGSNPSAGKIRVVCFYENLTEPTS